MLRCDRCTAGVLHVEPVLGKGLCAFCVRAFGCWVEAGSASSLKRHGEGKRLTQVRAIVAEHGYVTSELLAEVASIPLRMASGYLKSSAHQGIGGLTVLSTGRNREQRSRYGFKEAEAAE
jgi:hypothetical protein